MTTLQVDYDERELLMDHDVAEPLVAGRDANREATLGEVEHWCARHPRGADILEGFHALATPEPAIEARSCEAADQGEAT